MRGVVRAFVCLLTTPNGTLVRVYDCVVIRSLITAGFDVLVEYLNSSFVVYIRSLITAAGFDALIEASNAFGVYFAPSKGDAGALSTLIGSPASTLLKSNSHAGSSTASSSSNGNSLAPLSTSSFVDDPFDVIGDDDTESHSFTLQSTVVEDDSSSYSQLSSTSATAAATSMASDYASMGESTAAFSINSTISAAPSAPVSAVNTAAAAGASGRSSRAPVSLNGLIVGQWTAFAALAGVECVSGGTLRVSAARGGSHLVPATSSSSSSSSMRGAENVVTVEDEIADY